MGAFSLCDSMLLQSKSRTKSKNSKAGQQFKKRILQVILIFTFKYAILYISSTQEAFYYGDNRNIGLGFWCNGGHCHRFYIHLAKNE